MAGNHTDTHQWPDCAKVKWLLFSLDLLIKTVGRNEDYNETMHIPVLAKCSGAFSVRLCSALAASSLIPLKTYETNGIYLNLSFPAESFVICW